MPTVSKLGIGIQQFGGFTPYGNLTTLRASLSTNAAGAALDSNDTATPLAIGTVVRLQTLPEGFVLEDAQMIVSDAFSANMTASLGFAYVDGVDDANVPQDAAYFGTGLALSATARLRCATAKAPVKLPKPAYLILTTAGAANAVVGVLDVIVHGERRGPN